jgi:hypothetical protein
MDVLRLDNGKHDRVPGWAGSTGVRKKLSESL